MNVSEPAASPQQSKRRSIIGRVLLGLAVFVMACLAVGFFAGVIYSAMMMREFAAVTVDVERQISDVKAKESRKISLNDEVHPFHLVVFGKAYKKLDSTDDYELAVSYSRDVDPFLKEISDLKGARSLLLYRVDVTDAGLEAIPTMPDLAKVSITPNGGGHLTAAGIAELREQRPELSVELHPEEFVHDPSGARSND